MRPCTDDLPGLQYLIELGLISGYVACGERCIIFCGDRSISVDRNTLISLSARVQIWMRLEVDRLAEAPRAASITPSDSDRYAPE